MKSFYFLTFFATVFAVVSAQTSDVLEEYNTFLRENKNLSYSATSAMFPLQNQYYQAVPELEQLNSFSYMDSVDIKMNLSLAEKEMLAKNGFVVTERLNYEKFVFALKDIYFKDLPVMITTDMMLYALHASYDGILKNLEYCLLRPNLIEILQNFRSSYNTLVSKYSTYPELADPLRDVDLYISIPLALLGETSMPANVDNQETFDLLLAKIKAENGFEVMPLFSEHQRILDFSQFKTRGHYTEKIYTETGQDSLASYFKAMIWLGRMDFLLTPPPAFDEEPWSEEDIRRMNISALLLNELIETSGMRDKLSQNEKTIDLMVGESDNLTTGELNNICLASEINNAADLLDPLKYENFKKKLLSSPESGQKILSDIFMVDPYSSEPDPLPVSFRLLGQRFIIDSYFFSQLVFDRIIYEGEKIFRPLPSPLDAMFILGNNDALNLLEDEINNYHYGTQISCLRKLTDLYDQAFWQKSLYNSWLSCLRTLNSKPQWEGMPFFLSTAAWQHEKLNTQLASWSQLRHDNLLYAKQSYTGGMSCSYPYSYIEPYPEFYQGLAEFASQAGAFFNELPVHTKIKDYFLNLKATCDTLTLILHKQMSDLPYSDRETAFLKNMYVYQQGPMCGEVYEDGWYFDLLFEPGKEAVVADVHTQPTDQWGNIVGHVLHVGTGNVNLGVFLAYGPAPERIPMAFVGPVMSYYETVTNDFYRYNDEEWLDGLDKMTPPEWTSIYIVNKKGNAYAKGSELPYQIIQMPGTYTSPLMTQELLVFPNPVEDYLSILNSPSQARVRLYDIRGRLVFQCINEGLPLDLSKLEKGVYVLSIFDKGKTENTRIIKN